MSDSGIQVRAARFSEIPLFIGFAGHAATAALWTPAQYEATLADGNNHLALVVEQADKILGFVVARILPGEWEIQNIAVSGSARRRGLATRLMGELMNRARAQGAAQILLEVRESNRAARALYEKWGFEMAGRRKAYYQGPSEDAILYRFSFPQLAESD